MRLQLVIASLIISSKSDPHCCENSIIRHIRDMFVCKSLEGIILKVLDEDKGRSVLVDGFSLACVGVSQS